MLVLSVCWNALRVMFLVAWPILKWFLIILAIIIVFSTLKGFIAANSKKK